MKKINAIIFSLAIDKIDWVHLVGKETDIYKVYLEEQNNVSIKIDLKRDLRNNLTVLENDSIPKGELTRKVRPKIGIDYLKNCDFLTGTKPNNSSIDLCISLIKIKNFKPIKKEINKKLPFFLWIKQQINRDDLIGDVAYDIKRDTKDMFFMSFNQLRSRVENKQTNSWEINTFNDHNKKGKVSPILCLKLAKLEYDLIIKKEKLKKFKIYNTEGYIYFLRPENKKGPIKIGRAKDIEVRISQLQTSLPYDLVLIGKIQTNNYFKLEKKIHSDLEEKNIRREWFDINEDMAKKIIEMYKE